MDNAAVRVKPLLNHHNISTQHIATCCARLVLCCDMLDVGSSLKMIKFSSNICGYCMRPRPNIATFRHNIPEHCWPQYLQAPAKRSQHLCAFGCPVVTCCDMCGFEKQTSAHTRAQHCYMNLARLQRHVSCKCLQPFSATYPSMLRSFGHPDATCWTLKILLVCVPGRNSVARTWPNEYNRVASKI